MTVLKDASWLIIVGPFAAAWCLGLNVAGLLSDLWEGRL